MATIRRKRPEKHLPGIVKEQSTQAFIASKQILDLFDTVVTYLVVIKVEHRERRYVLQRGCKRLDTVATYLVVIKVGHRERRHLIQHRLLSIDAREILF
jgi:hypothetical protein